MAHMGGLCCAFHYRADPDVYRALQRSLNGLPNLQKPPLPASRGALTIAGVLQADDPESYTDFRSRPLTDSSHADAIDDAIAQAEIFANIFEWEGHRGGTR